jgi:hypothetical protein
MPHQKGDKVAADDHKDTAQVPLITDFSDEEKLRQSDRAEDKAVYVVKKAFASLNPKTQVLANLQKKYADEKSQSTPEYLADLRTAETQLLELRKKEIEHLDQLYIAHSQKNYFSTVLCCIGAVFCFSNPATGGPLMVGGAAGFGTAKAQDKWAKRSMTAVEHDLEVVQAEILKHQNYLKLQTGSRVTGSHAMTFGVSSAMTQYQSLPGQAPAHTVSRSVRS